MRWSFKRDAKTYPVGRILGWLFAGIPILLVLGLCAGVLGGGLGTYVRFADSLPKVPDLRNYRPKTVSTFYAEDGTVIGVFYREKRFPVPLKSLPKHVVNAFLAAEDARFFSHTGVDAFGILRAVIKNLKAGNFAQGGSTITQQVTRNFILSREKRLSRKIQEAILSFRLEETLSKEEILEIYLNEIYLGKGCYGIESAARTYFDKNAAELSVAEAAMLAGFVSNPSKYSNPRHLAASLKRREYVLDNMVRYGFLSEDEYQVASQEPPQFREHHATPYDRVPYFTEVVRRYIIDKYGEDRLYNEGLQVWTTCDLALQDNASESLETGIKAWEKRQHRPTGLVRRLKKSEAKEFLNSSRRDSYRIGDVVRAMVVETHAPVKQKGKRIDPTSRDCTIALAGNVRIRMNIQSPAAYRQRHLLEFRVQDIQDGLPVLEHLTVPPVQGAVVCIENKTGFVKALVGGVDFDRSPFNRAIQAYRQPGSAFKPLVYAAALEWGDYSPNTLILDEPIAVVTNPRRGEWVPSNADAQYRGLMTLRDALAQSRNVVAVKLLMDMGLDPAVRMARRMGIRSRLEKNLSLCLGTSEVTPLSLTAAYTVFPNMGVRVAPVLVKKVKDRFGNVLEDNNLTDVDLSLLTFQTPSQDQDELAEDALEGPSWHEPESGNENQLTPAMVREQHAVNQGSPLHPTLDALLSGAGSRPPVSVRPRPERAFSPTTAYLMMSMLRQTCVNGTAAAVTRLKRDDLAGKTGTTDDCSDAWFVGFNPTYTTGVWIGYDTKVSLGRSEHGATAALPVWMNFMKAALADKPCVGYEPPEGIVFAGDVYGTRTRNLGRLLEANPDRMFSYDTKPVCPIDSGFIVASAPANPLMMPVMAATNTRGLPYPRVRILSPTGQDLGVGYYMPDEKGVVTLRRDWPGLTGSALQATNTGESAATSPPSNRSNGSQGLAQRMVDYLRQMGWFQ